jgi:inosine/xanthosine triphosphatase
MLVCTGTKNPSKIAGIKDAFLGFYDEVRILGVEPPSDLPPQPFGIEEIISGAKKRAFSAISTSDECEFGVGVEAGLFEVHGTFYDVQIAYVVNRKGEGWFGFSPSFAIPKLFSDGILSGKYRELEEVADSHFKTKEVGEKGGVIKILSKGKVSREDLTYYAVISALIPFQNKELYL